MLSKYKIMLKTIKKILILLALIAGLFYSAEVFAGAVTIPDAKQITDVSI